MKNFLGNYTYLILPLFLWAIIVPIDCVFNIFIKVDANLIAAISGSLIGFLITAISILIAMNKSDNMKAYLKKYNITTWIIRAFLFGVVLFGIALIMSLFAQHSWMVKSIGMYAFLGACIDTGLIVFALIKLTRSVL